MVLGLDISLSDFLKRAVKFLVLTAMAATADVLFDVFTTYIYFDDGLTYFGVCSVLLLCASPTCAWLFLHASKAKDPGPFWKFATTIKIWEEAWESMKTDKQSFGLAFVALGEACVEAFPTSLVQQFSVMSKLVGDDGSRYYILRCSMLSSLLLMSKTLVSFDFYGRKNHSWREYILRGCFRAGEVGMRSLSISHFWLLLRPVDAATHGFSSFHMPILLLTSLLANLAMLKRYNADISVGQIAVWAFVFMVASPPSFLTIFNQFRSKLWLYRAFETIVMILLVATLGESPMKRIWDNLFFANVLLACLATMAIASFLENWLPSKPSTSGYKEILSAEEGLVPDESPLIAAIQEDDIIMAGLLGKLSDLNVPNAKDEIPLYFAESTAMVEVLIEAGTNPKSDHASHFLTESLKKSDDKEMPKELLEIGVQMDAEGKRVVLGKLCDAAKRNSFDAVSWLVTALPDEALLDEILLEKIIWSLRKVSADGTILHASHLLTACLQRNDYDDLAEKLLDLGVKSDLEGKRLALVKFCEAVKRDELERVKWFGRFEPDLNTATEDGVLPAEWVKSMAVLDYLQDHKCNVAIIGEATILEAPSEARCKSIWCTTEVQCCVCEEQTNSEQANSSHPSVSSNDQLVARMLVLKQSLHLRYAIRAASALETLRAVPNLASPSSSATQASAMEPPAVTQTPKLKDSKNRSVLPPKACQHVPKAVLKPCPAPSMSVKWQRLARAPWNQNSQSIPPWRKDRL